MTPRSASRALPRRAARGRRRGQSMVELAILVPVLLMLFLGSWTATTLAGDDDTALQATQAGARYAAELGGVPPSAAAISSACSVTSDPGTCQVDMDIIAEMLPVVGTNFPNATVREIDIYEPSGSGDGCTFASGTCPPNDGAYTAGEPINEYRVSGESVTPPATYSAGCAVQPLDCFTLGQRDQAHPDESELGVRLVFSYVSPTWSLFTISDDTQYSVVRLAPQE